MLGSDHCWRRCGLWLGDRLATGDRHERLEAGEWLQRLQHRDDRGHWWVNNFFNSYFFNSYFFDDLVNLDHFVNHLVFSSSAFNRFGGFNRFGDFIVGRLGDQRQRRSHKLGQTVHRWPRRESVRRQQRGCGQGRDRLWRGVDINGLCFVGRLLSSHFRRSHHNWRCEPAHHAR